MKIGHNRFLLKEDQALDLAAVDHMLDLAAVDHMLDLAAVDHICLAGVMSPHIEFHLDSQEVVRFYGPEVTDLFPKVQKAWMAARRARADRR